MTWPTRHPGFVHVGNQGGCADDQDTVDVRRAAPWLGLVARVGLGLVWIAAGALKLPDPAAAERAVRAYRLLPEGLVGPAAFGLPAVEIVLGLALVLGVVVRWAAVGSAVLLVVLVAAVGSAWARGLQIDCGCFGGGGEVGADQTAYPSEVLRDGGLLVVALALARWPGSRWSLGGLLAPPAGPACDHSDVPTRDHDEEETRAQQH